MLKANHTSQIYSLESDIARRYPREIAVAQGQIEALKNDMEAAKPLLAQDKDHFAMEISGKVYTERKEAGAAIIEACKALKAAGTEGRIGSYGAFELHSFMEELKELAKDDNRILFTGFVQGAMLDELYSNAYIYTLPSDLEGMPLSLLEAMSYGNCCLVSDIPECAEVVEDKALIFKKADVQDLQEKLQDACDHPERVDAQIAKLQKDKAMLEEGFSKTVAHIEELKTDIKSLRESLKPQKAEIKQTEKEIAKLEAKKAAAEAKAAEKAKKTEAESVVKKLLASGVSADEILEKLK